MIFYVKFLGKMHFKKKYTQLVIIHQCSKDINNVHSIGHFIMLVDSQTEYQRRMKW